VHEQARRREPLGDERPRTLGGEAATRARAEASERRKVAAGAFGVETPPRRARTIGWRRAGAQTEDNGDEAKQARAWYRATRGLRCE
jgi:hypothetical protein